jgi:hypothetical protein
VTGDTVRRLPRRRLIEDDERRGWLATTTVVALALLAALALVVAVTWRITLRNADKAERQSVACIQQGGAWIGEYGSCVYSKRALP